MNGKQLLDALVRMGVAQSEVGIMTVNDVIYWVSAYKGFFHEGEGQYVDKDLLDFIGCDQVIFYLKVKEESVEDDTDQIGFYFKSKNGTL